MGNSPTKHPLPKVSWNKMVLRKNAIIIGMIGALAFLAILPLAQAAYSAPTSNWTWICKTGVPYSWTLKDGSTATWTFTSMKNTSITQGYANGTIDASGFAFDDSLPIYTIDFDAENISLGNANFLRTGGWVPYTSLQATFPGGVIGNITYPPTYLNTMKMLNKSLWNYVDGNWTAGNIGSSSITYLTGHAAAWRISYVHASNPKQMANWTIAVTGLVKDFNQTDAAGLSVASAVFNYPPVGFFGFDPTVEASLWLGIITIAVGVIYTLSTKKQDRQEDAEDAALKKMVAEKVESAPAPKKEGE